MNSATGAQNACAKIAVLEGIVSHRLAMASAARWWSAWSGRGGTETRDQRPETRDQRPDVTQRITIFLMGWLFELTSTAKLIDEPVNQADDYADDEAGDDREIKRAVFAAIADVAGQTTEAERKSWCEVEERADEDEYC